MIANPLVSVVIPAFNAHDFIGETLDSILSQTYKNIEIIVVDDGSTDNTPEIVQGYGAKVHYYHQLNSGGCAVPRNTGIKHSSGKYLCFIDADDIMVPDRIACQVDFMERHPLVGLVFCDYLNFNRDGHYAISHFQTCPHLRSQLKEREELVFEKACADLMKENFGIAGSFMFRKTLLALEAGFEPTLKSCEDFHFYFRLSRHAPVGIINKVGLMRRLHENNMSGHSTRMFTEGIRCRSLLRDSEIESGIRALLDGYIADCHGALARYHADHGEYIQALKKDGLSLLGNFNWPRFIVVIKNIARTLLMVIGLHTPKNDL